MRRHPSVFAFVLFVCSSGAFAGDEQAVAAGLKRHDVGGNYTLDLPEQWTSKSLPISWPGAKDFRFSTLDLEVGVTMLPVPEQPQAVNMQELVVRGMTPYLRKSMETGIEAVPFTYGNLHGAHGSLNARPGGPGFAVFGGAEYACVTTVLEKAPGIIYSISIASKSCAGSEHQAALRAVTTMQAGSSEAPVSKGVTELALPDGGKLSYAAPPMKKVKETSKRGRYEYLATSMDEADKRFNLSVFVEPSKCAHGKTSRDVMQCFIDKADGIPGIDTSSLKSQCSDDHCDVIYGTKVAYEGREIRQLHANLIFAYREKDWGHVHLSIISPTEADFSILTIFTSSLKYQ